MKYLLVAFALLFSHANIACSAETTPENLNEILTYYYQDPSDEKVATVLAALNGDFFTKHASARPAVMGFLAAIFTEQPQKTDDFLKLFDYSPLAQNILAYSLWLAQQGDKAQSLLTKEYADKQMLTFLQKKSTGLKKIELTSPSDLDQLWGAYAASGDIHYVTQIADVAERALRDEDVSTTTFVYLATRMQRPTPAAKKLFGYYQKQGKLSEILLGTTALWSLAGNMDAHKGVADFVRNTAAADRSPKFANALAAMDFSQQQQWITFAEDGRQLLVFSSNNPRYGDYPLKSLINFEHEEDVTSIFAPDDAVHIMGMVTLAPDQAASLNVTLKRPDGTEQTYGPIQFDPAEKNQASIQILNVGLDDEDLTGAGVYHYTVHGTYAAAPISLESAFLVLAQE